MLHNNTKDKIDRLKHNLDTHSAMIVDNFLKKSIHIPDNTYAHIYKTTHAQMENYFDKPKEKHYREDYLKNVKEYKKEYKLPIDFYDIEVFYFHHGLKHAGEKLKNYIKNKDFLDIGAYIGDSVLTLAEYKPPKIHSFEISKENIANYKKTMDMNNISQDIWNLVEKGVSDTKKQ